MERAELEEELRIIVEAYLNVGAIIQDGLVAIFNWLVPFTEIVLEEAESQGFFLGDPVT